MSKNKDIFLKIMTIKLRLANEHILTEVNYDYGLEFSKYYELICLIDKKIKRKLIK